MSRANGSVRNVALYRKYRPSTFAEVVGQAHVTEPLSTALDSGRINHAYLFSGPRGCGKTSSARIMARSLNCVEGPTSTPCGKCDSCLALGPGGAGHLDVTEIDAATHNGVEDMRELRERAFFAPAESRYRVIIIDEAHMISQSGFNALLKIVEEPPEHLIFIFATTEPEKMLATIRSRTHNYPFRLLTPPDMRGLLESVVSGEGVPVEDSVYPLVIRAGGGSPRDSLSIMDQLLAGAGPDGVTYERAVGVLGMTDASLIDRAVESLAQQDQAGLFTVVDEVIDAGYDPRRFAEDLLDRFRDLLMVFAVPDAVSRGLVNAPKDVEQRLLEQSQQLGQATLTRCTALVNESLQQMRGATAPRLLLEIMCARMALPAAGMTVESLAQRVEQLERGGGLQVPGAGTRSGGASGVGGAGGGVPSAGGEGARPKYERPKDRREREAREAREAQSSPAEQSAQAARSEQAEQTAHAARSEQAVQPAQSGTEASRAVGDAQVPRAAGEAVDSAKPEAASGTAESPKPETASGTAESPKPEVATGAGSSTGDEDPVLAQARKAREILDRHRGSDAQSDSPASNQSAENVWQALLEEVKAEHLSTWVAARDAQVYPEQQPPAQSGVLYVKHHTGALANYLNNSANSAVLSQAAQTVAGQMIRVIAATSPTPPADDSDDEAEPEPAGDSDPAAPAQAPKTSRAVDALERARAMAEARGPAHSEPDTSPGTSPVATSASPARQQAFHAQHTDTHEPADSQGRPTGWRARMDRMRSKQEYNRANGFNGVPLPDEPPEDPWASGTPDPSFYGGGGGEVASTGENPSSYGAAPGQQGRPSAGDQSHGVGAGGAQLAKDSPQPIGAENPGQQLSEEELRRQQEEEILEDLGRGTRGELDHRTPLEVAGELIEQHLGGERVR